jgi:D-inositol-3-phosphate glycosyltransferase
MGACLSSPKTLTKDIAASGNVAPALPIGIEVALLTGGFDKPYVFGLAMALSSKSVCLDVVGSDDVDSPEMHTTARLNFLNLWGSRRETGLASKVSRVLIYYARLVRYAAVAEPKIFHILWNNKFELFDRTLLMLYYKLLKKKIVFTAHNVNAGKRDSNDSLLNRSTLRVQYQLADHVFVHTEKMKRELLRDFGVREGAVSVIPFGINNSVPQTDLTPSEAKQRLGIRGDERAILFFGAIRPYKGLEHLVAAFQRIAPKHEGYRLVIAGEPRKGAEQYLHDIQENIARDSSRGRVIQMIKYIPDSETELYFKAADVLVLPYTYVFQSGVLFLAYSFGLPVIVADVGSFRDDVIRGKTGYLCPSCDPADLANTIETYFESDLFKDLDRRRREIRDYANARNSWDVVGERTCNVYAELLGRRNADDSPGEQDCRRRSTKS